MASASQRAIGNDLAKQQGDEILAKYWPGGIGAFFGVVGPLVGDTFAPSVDAFAVDRDEGDAAVVDPSKAGLEKMYQRHVQFTQGDGFDFHGLAFRPILFAAESLGDSIRPGFVPVTQEKRAVPFHVSFVPQNTQVSTESLQKQLAIAGLDVGSFVASGRRSFPGRNFRRDLDLLYRRELRLAAVLQQPLHAI